MIKKIINAIKIFFLGLFTGIITTIISYLYIKNQKVIKKIIKVKKNEKDIKRN